MNEHDRCESQHKFKHKIDLILRASGPKTMDQVEATSFLESLIGKTLHITVLDGRLFVGVLKCTDNESNVILANSFEYRLPSERTKEAMLESTKSSNVTAKADMISRYVGLIVIPGFRISQIQLEDPISQSSQSAAANSASNLTIRTKS